MSTVTIKDVAARAGVSAKTVSRVMNGEAYVRPQVREAVMKVVTELSYRPNTHARSLSSSRSFLIALFFDDPASGYAADVQMGAITRCRHHGHHLVVERVDRSADCWLSEAKVTIETLRPAGVVLTPPVCDWTELTDLLTELEVPFVCLAPSRKEVTFPTVTMDDFAAARDMTIYLIGLGHRDIAFVEGIRSHGSAEKRLAGFRAAMMDAALPVREDWICEGDYTFRAGFAAGGTLLSGSPRPTAIFAANDELALGVLVSAMRLDVAVPAQLSVAGFDDAPISRMAWPQLTTIRQPNNEMAAAAVDVLVNWKNDPNGGAFAVKELGYNLIIRQSTGLK